MRQLSRQVEPIAAFRPPHVLSHALQMVASGELCAIRQTLTTLQTMDDGDLRKPTAGRRLVETAIFT
jgi:hypothetical protein